MSMALDKDFINRISGSLDRFSWEQNYVAHFRCPICGDSQTSQVKRRGYFYPDSKENCLRFKCHNCNEMSGWSFQVWLRDFNHVVYREYMVEKFKEIGQGSREHQADARLIAPKASTTARITVAQSNNRLPAALLEHCVTVASLPQGHFARKYVESRLLPSWALELLCFTECYSDLVKGIGAATEDTEAKLPEDARLIIPLLSETNQLLGVQGRALGKHMLRYATAKLNDNFPKTFGLERINRKKPILVVEGPIDSLFLPNCVATADSNLLKFEGADIYIPDNQYRNFEIVKMVDKIIGSGNRVCLFPKEVEHFKDINDMVKDGGLSQQQLLSLIASNTYRGAKAKLIFSKLRGV